MNNVTQFKFTEILSREHRIYLGFVVGPRCDSNDAGVFVERKMSQIHWAVGTKVYCGKPINRAIADHRCQLVSRNWHHLIPVKTTKNSKEHFRPLHDGIAQLYQSIAIYSVF